MQCFVLQIASSGSNTKIVPRLVCNDCNVQPLRGWLVTNVNMCTGRTMRELLKPEQKRLPVPVPSSPALLLANNNHHLLQRLNVKYLAAQNCYNKVQARDDSVQQYIIHKVPRALPASYVQRRAHGTTEDKLK